MPNQIVISVVALFISISLLVPGCKKEALVQDAKLNAQNQETGKRIPVTLKKHIDGDTSWFFVEGKPEKVRYLAIDTQETVSPEKQATKMGYKASEYVKGILTKAQTIELEYDPNSDDRDKYGRVLAWIWVDKKLLQQEKA